MTFKVITPESVCELSKCLSAELCVDADELVELLESFSFEDSDEEYAVAATDGCAIIRIFDMGRYIFSYPYEFSEDADVAAAIDAISRYAIREELPLVLSDVPKDEIPTLLSLGFRHVELDAEDGECECYRAKIVSECELLEDIPTVYDGELSLTPLSETDIPVYAEISRETTALRYWGYDYREDAPDAADDYFYMIAERDFLAGISMTLAIRYCGELVGEVQTYAFDRRGGADFALRLLPSARNKGIGKRCLALVFKVASTIGLSKLCCDVSEENKPSIAFVSSAMMLCKNENGILRFEAEI
jgi:RimJ/RimL family protein N-acetyltransferase